MIIKKETKFVNKVTGNYLHINEDMEIYAGKVVTLGNGKEYIIESIITDDLVFVSPDIGKSIHVGDVVIYNDDRDQSRGVVESISPNGIADVSTDASGSIKKIPIIELQRRQHAVVEKLKEKYEVKV
jgi:hypothetical protein